MRRHFMRAGKRAMVLNQIHGINTNDKSLKATFKNLIYCNKIKENVQIKLENEVKDQFGTYENSKRDDENSHSSHSIKSIISKKDTR